MGEELTSEEIVIKIEEQDGNKTYHINHFKDGKLGVSIGPSYKVSAIMHFAQLMNILEPESKTRINRDNARKFVEEHK